MNFKEVCLHLLFEKYSVVDGRRYGVPDRMAQNERDLALIISSESQELSAERRRESAGT